MSGLLKSLIADLEGVTNWVEQNGLKLNEANTQMLYELLCSYYSLHEVGPWKMGGMASSIDQHHVKLQHFKLNKCLHCSSSSSPLHSNMYTMSYLCRLSLHLRHILPQQ